MMDVWQTMFLIVLAPTLLTIGAVTTVAWITGLGAILEGLGRKKR